MTRFRSSAALTNPCDGIKGLVLSRACVEASSKSCSPP